MQVVADQEGWNEVLVGSGFITVNIPCDFTFEATPADVDIHHTSNAQIWGHVDKTLYIRNPSPEGVGVKLSYAIGEL